MKAAEEKGIPGWLAFTTRAMLLCFLTLGAAAYPFFAWKGVTGLYLLAIGAGLELVLISVSYALLEVSLRRLRGLVYHAVLAGWLIRLGPTIAALLLLWYMTDLPQTAAVVSVVLFYLLFIFYEAKVCWPPAKR